MTTTNAAQNEIRPYQLPQPKYALWYDAHQLGTFVQTAVGHYLCGGKKIALPNGQQIDERSKEILKEFARKRGVLIPDNAF